MVAAILEPLSPYIKSLTLIPGDGGVFDVRVDGEEVFSKLLEMRFAEPEEIVKAVRERAR
ncbi:MAG: SelT/SelW/SelH family protein [Chloroflexi bacterium]|nr:SelT/SelW/SelH family protein [Chloroflexota bacterium]